MGKSIVDTLLVLIFVLSMIIPTQTGVLPIESADDDELVAEQSTSGSSLGENDSGQVSREIDGLTAAEIGAQFPPGNLLNVPNPLRDQPNLSSGRLSATDQIIHGSRNAFTVTKVEYLKKEWCKTEPLKQVIREEGCLQRTVVNRFCYGQCNSFFIPKSNKKDLESAAFKSCSFCKPKRYSWITVTLRCPRRKPRFKRKRIQMIKQCKCMAQKLD